jgi:hypothetical protein
MKGSKPTYKRKVGAKTQKVKNPNYGKPSKKGFPLFMGYDFAKGADGKRSASNPARIVGGRQHGKTLRLKTG